MNFQKAVSQDQSGQQFKAVHTMSGDSVTDIVVSDVLGQE